MTGPCARMVSRIGYLDERFNRETQWESATDDSADQTSNIIDGSVPISAEP